MPEQNNNMCEYGSENWYNQVFLVPDEDAPFRMCSENQEYNGCLKPSRDLKTCQMHRENHPELDEPLIAGCKCIDGYFFENGECIPEAQCPEYSGTYQGFDTDGDGVGDFSRCSLQDYSGKLIDAGKYLEKNFDDTSKFMKKLKK